MKNRLDKKILHMHWYFDICCCTNWIEEKGFKGFVIVEGSEYSMGIGVCGYITQMLLKVSGRPMTHGRPLRGDGVPQDERYALVGESFVGSYVGIVHG